MHPFIQRIVFTSGLLAAAVVGCGGGSGSGDVLTNPPFSELPDDDGRSFYVSPGGLPSLPGPGNGPGNGQGAGGNNQAGTNGEGGQAQAGTNGEGGQAQAGTNGEGGQAQAGTNGGTDICNQCPAVVACQLVDNATCEAICGGVSAACASCINAAGGDCDAIGQCPCQ